MIQSTPHSVKHGGGSVLAQACMASNGTGSLVFIDDMTKDRSSLVNSEMYWDFLSAQIQTNAIWMVLHSTDGQGSKTMAQSPDLNQFSMHFKLQAERPTSEHS